MVDNTGWNFPYGKNLTPTGSNHASIETFRDNVIDSLTREILQNSLDAHDSRKKEPVHVVFDKMKISNKDIPNINRITDYALPKAKKYWESVGNKDTLKYLDKFDQIISSSEISLLKISDYNTIGLLPENFQSLIHADAYSEKRDDTASGSKGIGKAAPFAASGLRMVFYSSLAKDNIQRSAGILNFVSFIPNKDKSEKTQSRASFLDLNNSPINRQLNFNNIERKTGNFGTELFIIGFKEFEDWAENIKISTLENFLISIFDGELEVSINGELISKNNLDSVLKLIDEKELNKAGKNRLQSIRNYYDVLVSEDTKKFHFDERFEKYNFIENLNDGILRIKEHEPANRKVLQTRQAGMKIYERTHISGTINFTGIFQAVGHDLNSYLRDIENPNHNDWSVDRIDPENRKEKKIASNFLRDLFQWYKEKVKASFEAEIKEKIGAFGVADLLPILSDKEENDSDNEDDDGIQFKISSFDTNKKRKSKSYSGRIEEEDAQLDQLVSEIDKAGQEEEFDNDDSSFDGGPSNEPGDGEATGGKSLGGSLSESGDDINRRVSYKKINTAKALKVKLLEKDSNIGLYQIVGKHISNYKKLALEFSYIDARNMTERAKLVEADSKYNNVTLENNKLIIKDLSKNQSLNIQFKVNKNIRLKMRIDLYEIHS